VEPKPTLAQRVALVIIGLLILAFLLAPWPLLTKLRALSFGLDPQRSAHSHFLGGIQLPLEARKMGIYGGFVLTVVYLGWLGRGRSTRLPPLRLMVLLAGFIGVMAVDGTNNFLFDLHLPHLYAPDNQLRLATGLLTGFTVGAVVWPIFNFTFWGDQSGPPSLVSLGELFFGLVPCAALFAVEISGFGVALVPLAILGGVGVVGLVTLLNIIVVLIVTRREGQANSVWDAALPTLAGLILATVELGGLAAVRYAVFGMAQLP
jgi:uncharacterized membrane protein